MPHHLPSAPNPYPGSPPNSPSPICAPSVKCCKFSNQPAAGRPVRRVMRSPCPSHRGLHLAREQVVSPTVAWLQTHIWVARFPARTQLVPCSPSYCIFQSNQAYYFRVTLFPSTWRLYSSKYPTGPSLYSPLPLAPQGQTQQKNTHGDW